MKRRGTASSRPGTNILWLIVSIIVLLSGASTFLSFRHAEDSNDRVTSRARERIQTTTAGVDEYLAQRISVLEALSTAPVLVQGTPEEQDAYFAQVELNAIGFGGGFGLVSLDGVMTAFANAPSVDATVDVRSRSYFQAVTQSGAPFVSEAVVAQPTGNLVVPIAVPVRNLVGAMTGILVGALRLDASGEAPLLSILNPDVTIVDRAGQVIVERGAIASLRSVADNPVYRTLIGRGAGVDDDAIDLTGEQNQLVSYGSVAAGSWLVVAEVPRSEAFGGVRRQLLEELGLKGLLSVLALTGAMVTARHLNRAATDILQSEHRYRALVEANSAAVWRYLPGRRHSETSPWWREFTGQTPDQMDNLGWLDAVHPHDRERTAALWTDSIAAGQPFAGTFQVRSTTGEFHQLDMRGVPVPSTDGRTVEWIGTYVDVTEERHQEEALRISEERQRLALVAADLGAWDWDLLTGDVTWSPVVERHVGLDPGTFSGTIEAFRAFIHPEDRDMVVRSARHAIEDGKPYAAEFRMVRKDGAIRWTKTSGLVIRDWMGKPVRLLGIEVDVTEEKARQSERLLFLASVAHDLKNPIAVLKASAQLLQRRAARGIPLDSEEAMSRLAVIESNATRLARRLDDLSDLSQLEAGHAVDLAVGRVDLVPIAATCIEASRRVSVAHNLRLVADEQSIIGSWDATRLERVIDNLVSNAIKYSPNGGEVVVRLWSDPVNAYVSVQDQGIGVPSTEREAVFQFRRRGSNVGDIVGSGVGLAGASRLVELIGGEITVEPNDGVGTTFTVRLPRLAPGERA